MQLSLLLVCVVGSFANPVSQPVYQNTPYISAQAIQPVQYRQPQAYLQPQYISAQAVPTALQTTRPVYETEKNFGLQKFSTQIKQPIQLLPATPNLQYQITKTPQAQGQDYLQTIQSAHQALSAAAQRKVAPQTLSRPAAIAPQPQPQPQQFLREVPQQQTQIKYVKPAAVVAQSYRPVVSPGQQGKDQQEDYDPNPSYQFGFDVSDDLYTNYQNRKEQREGNKITGSYSVVDSDGFVRTVTYTADPKEGFKAEVTRQPTDIVVKIPKPDPQFQRQQPQQQQYVQAVPEKAQLQAAQKPNLIYQYQQ